MKKFVFGAMIACMGFLFSGFCFINAVLHPWDYNGVSGLLGAFLGTETLIAFVIAGVVQ